MRRVSRPAVNNLGGCCRDCMCPVVLTRGADQTAVSTAFDVREDDNVVRNYGRMLVELAAAIPDGIVCFFVSYSYMDKIVSKWNDMGILQVVSSPCFTLPQIQEMHACLEHPDTVLDVYNQTIQASTSSLCFWK